MTKVKAHVSEGKKKIVKEMTNLIGEKRTVLVASIKNLPAAQYQKIVKKLREKAVVKVPRKNLLLKSIEESKKEKLSELKEKLGESFAILFSDIDSFDLASDLLLNKTPAKAKAGQEAPEDITIQPGPTDLMPGPAISELGALGIPIQIEKGKIAIKEAKTIVKAGEKISQAAADVMGKLDIKPFSIGFIPLYAYDSKEDKLYLTIDIDTEGAREELKKAFGKALPFAVEIGYATDETIKYLLGKAGLHEKSLNALVKESTGEVTSEEQKVVSEENQTSENKSEEEKK